MYCRECGKENPDDAVFCANCGTPLNKADGIVDKKKTKKGIFVIIGIVGLICITGVLAFVLLSKKQGNAQSREQVVATIASEKITVAESSVEETVESSTETDETTEEADTGEYILPECDGKYYTEDELTNLTSEELRLARNEIFARHGRKFKTEDLNNYFSAKSWYNPLYEADEFDKLGDSIFNEYEIANRNLIVDIENRKTPITSDNEELKGSYVLKGSEYIFVKKYYIDDNTLYIVGDYCDGVYNPEAEDEGDTMRFYIIRENVKVSIDENTDFRIDNVYDIYKLQDYIGYIMDNFGETYLSVVLRSNLVSIVDGSWQPS